MTENKPRLGVLALMLLLSCASFALAWEPQWEHDEDLSDYKLCENFGDITLKIAVTDHAGSFVNYELLRRVIFPLIACSSTSLRYGIGSVRSHRS